MADWKYIDEYDSLPAESFIHCDTRDFHIICTDSSPYESDKRFRSMINSAPSSAKFNRSEILGCLKALEEASGGKGEWRMLSIGQGWLKYIRFKKTNETVDLLGGPEPVYVAYVSFGNQYDLLYRDQLQPERIIKDRDMLCHIKRK